MKKIIITYDTFTETCNLDLCKEKHNVEDLTRIFSKLINIINDKKTRWKYE